MNDTKDLISVDTVKEKVAKIVCELRLENRKAHDNGDDYQSVCDYNRKVELGLHYLMSELGWIFAYENGIVNFERKGDK